MSAAFFGVVAALSYAFPGLPPEVVYEVFTQLCLLHDPVSRSFSTARCRVSLVCHSWRIMVNQTRLFWHHLVVDTDSTPSGLSAFLTYSNPRPIAVTFSSRPQRTTSIESILPPPLAPAPPRHNPDTMLMRRSLLSSAALIAPSIHRWKSLALHIDNPNVIHALITVFSPLSVPCLGSLTIHCAIFDSARSAALYDTLPAVFLQGHFPALLRLFVDGVPPPWSSFRTVTTLVNLRIASVANRLWPTFASFTQFIIANPGLRHLSLGALGFTEMPHSLPTIPLPNVVRLEISLASEKHVSSSSLWIWVSCLELPNLTHLGVRSINRPAMRAFLLSPLSFTVRNVQLTSSLLPGQGPDLETMRQFYSRLRNVLSLRIDDSLNDIVLRNFLSLHVNGAQQNMVKALGSAVSEPSTTVLPLLSHLSISQVDWAVLLSVHSARRSMSVPTLVSLRCDVPPEPQPTYGHLLRRLPASLAMSDVLHVPAQDLPAYQSVVSDIPDFAWLTAKCSPIDDRLSLHYHT
ncbi:hypothetical protein DFH06DRAFT_1348312 [Mycena polygramma]|nr:hypothetical protein DFH06DRAFT_1348312 [Mycena polygramma]